MMGVGVASPFTRLIGIGASVPIGQRGLVHVWGRNDMATEQRMGIAWVVRDPDGMVVEEYSLWEMWPYTNPDTDHEFIGDRFDIEKPGNWTITIELLMNPDNPVIVDSYDGLLCVVSAEVFAGTITRKELEYDETRGAIPVS